VSASTSATTIATTIRSEGSCTMGGSVTGPHLS
jgi:hypothetical protein